MARLKNCALLSELTLFEAATLPIWAMGEESQIVPALTLPRR
jgi:hypothetical protein